MDLVPDAFAHSAIAPGDKTQDPVRALFRVGHRRIVIGGLAMTLWSIILISISLSHNRGNYVTAEGVLGLWAIFLSILFYWQLSRHSVALLHLYSALIVAVGIGEVLLGMINVSGGGNGGDGVTIWLGVMGVIQGFLLFQFVFSGQRLIADCQQMVVAARSGNDDLSHIEASAMVITRIQAMVRGHQSRARLLRSQQIDIWENNSQVRSERTALKRSVVFFHTVLTAFLIYIALIYGAEFDGATGKKWLGASFLALLLNGLIQEPFVIAAKSIAGESGRIISDAIAAIIG